MKMSMSKKKHTSSLTERRSRHQKQTKSRKTIKKNLENHTKKENINRERGNDNKQIL